MTMQIDAGLFPEDCTIPTTTFSVSPSSEIIREISSSLSSADIKKLYFLCLDMIAPEQPCPQTLEELLSFIDSDDSVLMLKVLLYHIKKYRLLKSLQTCRHQMKIALENRKYITQGRSSLFYLCENLENEAVKQLKFLLGEKSAVTEGWETVAAEDFFRVWLREIDDDKMHLLRQVLETMNRCELATKLSWEELLYHVITPSRGKPCGLAVIFNNETFNKPLIEDMNIYRNKSPNQNLSKREGTNVDEENLCTLWKSFGLDVVIFRDKTYPVMMDIIKHLSNLDYSNYSLFVCCILTHGDQGVVYTSDNIPVDIFNEVVYQFNSSDVPSLNNKPKIFLIQACQGKGAQIVSPPASNLQTDSSVCSSNDKRDMLWVLSAIPSHMSFRDITNGSWFINSLVDVFEKHGTKKPVRDLLDQVNLDVSNRCGLYGNVGFVKQMPVVSATTFGTLRLKRIENNSGFSQRIQQQCSEILLPIYKFASAMHMV